MEIGNHKLNIKEEEYPEKFLPILNRLKEALNNPEIRKKMQEEDEFWKAYQSEVQEVAQNEILNKEQKN